MKPLLSAVAFLTRIPVPASVHTGQKALRHCAAWFAVVGFLLGAIYAGTAWALRWILPPSAVAVFVLIVDALLTGALHLDGLADMADGFGGGHTREDILRIMRDHAIGSYGGVALILALLFKFVCLAELLQQGLWFLFVVPAFARWAILLLSVSQPYARPTTTGSGSLATFVTRRHLLLSSLFCLALAIGFGWPRCLLCWLVTAAVTALTGRFSNRRIGGITGDVLGANTVICEAMQFAAALAAVGPVHIHV